MAAVKHMSMSISDTWGIGCLRQTAGFPAGNGNKFQYMCPIGPLIVVWDIEKKQRILSKQVADDFISVLIKNDVTDLILMVSYSGQGKLLNSALTSVCPFEVPGCNVIYASWLEGGSLFSLCTIGHASSLFLFEVDAGKDGVVSKVSLKWSVKASMLYRTQAQQQESLDDEACDHDDCCDDATASANKNDQYQSYYGCMFSEENTIISIFNRQNSPFEIHLYNLEGICLQKQPVSPLGDSRTSMLCMSECRNGRFAVGMERGVFVFIESKSLDTLSVFQSQGSAQVCLWDGDLLTTVAYQSGVLQWWSISGEIIKEARVENAESVIHLSWSIPGKELWIGGVTSLNYFFVQSSPSLVSGATANVLRMLTLIEHKVAGCGLSFKDNSTLATGDLAGNVFISKMGTDFKFDDTRGKINIKSSVRCLVWVLDELFIGTLEGTLFKWVVTENGNPTNYKLIYNFPFGVLSMRTSNSQKLLAIGTGGGDLYIFDTVKKFQLMLETRTHMPQNIGQEMEERFMEIWSIAWEPSDSLIATASEDKSSVVTDAKTGMCLYLWFL